MYFESKYDSILEERKKNMFTDDEVELLMESLDALQAKESSDMLLMGMMRIGFTNSKEEAENVSDEVLNEMKEAQEKSKGLKNRIILLKAKLIQMQDASAVEEAKKFLEGN